MAEQDSVLLGETKVRRIGLGTNRLTNTAANVDFIRRAVDAGIGLVDTAHLYTGGDSEQAIGAAGVAGRAVVATKGGFRPGEGRPEVLRQQIESSLRSLRTERIDLYYLHRVDPETPLEDSLATIGEYVERGQIGLVGMSEVSVEQIERGRKVVPIAAVQNEYNLGQRRWDPVVDYCEREGIIFVPFYPLHGRGERSAQDALAWLLRRSPVMLPIPGTLSLEHVRHNLAALEAIAPGGEPTAG